MKFYIVMALSYSFDASVMSLSIFIHANKCITHIREFYISLTIFLHVLQAERLVTNRCNFHRLKLNSQKLQETMEVWFPFLNLQCLWLFKVMHIYKCKSPKVMRALAFILLLSFYNKWQSVYKEAVVQPPMLHLLICILIQTHRIPQN